MRSVRIVTDSTADIPATLASDLGISIVPCQVYFGEQTYQDRVNLSPEEYFDKLARSVRLPRTSQPPVARFVDVYRHLLSAGPEVGVVSIHVAGNLSGTVNSAWTAAQMLPEPSRVEVIDSGQVSMGMGWAVVVAARLAQSGVAQAEVGQAVRDILPRLRTAAMIDTLDNLYKGGRISQISATLGTVLRIKPMLSVREGKVQIWDKVRTRSRALKRLVTHVQGWGPLAEMAILHTGSEGLQRDLAHSLQELVPAERVVLEPAGPALTTHLGLGAVGVCALVDNGGEGSPP
jgi:DegV family protein with EDD domain